MQQFEGKQWIGQGLSRVDGQAKVSGTARYAAEVEMPRTAQAVVLTSTIANGRVRSMQTDRAHAVAGVLDVFTPFRAPRLDQTSPRVAPYAQPAMEVLSPPLFVLQSPRITYRGAAIGLVVAETFELARYAASLVQIEYDEERPVLDLRDNLDKAFTPPKLMIELPSISGRGDLMRGMSSARHVVDTSYSTPAEHHAQMEPGATLAHWTDGRLTVYTTSQDVCGWQQSLCNTFQIPLARVRVLSRFIGGGFGGKNGTWEHAPLAAMAARAVGRPVKLVFTREQMFALHGHRAHQTQRIRLGCGSDGKLTAIGQDILVQTSIERSFVEHTGETTGMIYACDNVAVSHRGVRTNIPLPTIMRAPGAAPGMFALESAMDELAEQLGQDPIEFRVANHADRDPEKALPWSVKSLRQCYLQGAERFGWNRRSRTAGSMRDGRWRVGMGMATATYPANRLPCSARVRLADDGSATVELAATDIGTGTYTVLGQIAADALELPMARVRVVIGDSDLPRTPGSGGSWGAMSYGTAVLAACQALRTKLDRLSRGGVKPEDYSAALKRIGRTVLEATADTKPDDADKRVSMHAFGAHFCEVRVDPDTGEIRVPRLLGAYGIGRPLNVKTARSQLLGGMCWGLGMALTEGSVLDLKRGHFVNANLAEYHIPVHADIRELEVMFVNERETERSPLGGKGLGEIGIVGVAAAVANAVWHATGVRVRELPITLDKVLAGWVG